MDVHCNARLTLKGREDLGRASQGGHAGTGRGRQVPCISSGVYIRGIVDVRPIDFRCCRGLPTDAASTIHRGPRSTLRDHSGAVSAAMAGTCEGFSGFSETPDAARRWLRSGG